MTAGIINGFEAHLRERNLTDATRANYTGVARRLDIDPATCSADDLRAFLSRCDLTPASRNVYLFGLRALFKFAVAAGLRGDNPADTLQLAKTPPLKQPDVLTKTQWRRLSRAVDKPRDRALFYLLAGCGLRISEALGLTADSFTESADGATLLLTVIGKGRKERTVAVPPGDAEKAVREHMLRVPPRVPMFQITQQHAGRMLRYYAQRAGLKIDIHPHMLRHSYATWCVDHDVDIITLSRTMGHSNLQTTRRYVALTDIKRAQVADIIRGVI